MPKPEDMPDELYGKPLDEYLDEIDIHMSSEIKPIPEIDIFIYRAMSIDDYQLIVSHRRTKADTERITRIERFEDPERTPAYNAMFTRSEELSKEIENDPAAFMLEDGQEA
jgi:hypothetical protein